MKKILAILLALILVLCMAAPALAVTPALPVPDIPEVPDIGDDIDFGIDFGGIVDDWLEEHPVPPPVPTEPEGTEPQSDFYTELDMDTPGARSWINWLRELFRRAP